MIESREERALDGLWKVAVTCAVLLLLMLMAMGCIQNLNVYVLDKVKLPEFSPIPKFSPSTNPASTSQPTSQPSDDDQIVPISRKD